MRSSRFSLLKNTPKMLSRTITSLQHPFVKYCVKLRTSKSFRLQEKKAVIFGSKLIAELSRFTKLKILLETDLHSTNASAEETYIITDDIIKKISGMPSPEPVAAIIDIPSEQDLSNLDFIVILDRIADPGNLGTLLRCSMALGWGGVFLLDGCCDPFNDKALRAAKGATFKMPIQSGDISILKKMLCKKNHQVYVADIAGSDFRKINFEGPIALVLGNESHGPTDLIKSVSKAISIPMHLDMESLNVATAGAILLQHIRSL
ncbi:MAG: RNA methyltransferase [Chlamydiae bacterium]|nr:RNA methyltransferase [Chlamydiota bacterium]